MLLQKCKTFYNNILFYNNVWQKNVNRLKIMLAIAHGIAISYVKRWICLYNMFYPSLYPLLFFPAHGKILAWAGRKIYPGREGNLKEYFGE